MSSDTGPAATEIKKLREAIEETYHPHPNYGIQQPTNGNGKAEIYKIVVGVAAFLAVVVLGIFGWVAEHVMGRQDSQDEQMNRYHTEEAQRLATVEAKLDILIGQKNGKP